MKKGKRINFVKKASEASNIEKVLKRRRYREGVKKRIPDNSMYIARSARPGGLKPISQYITHFLISHSFPDMYYFKVLNKPIKR
jgi:hypothetical protein